MNSTQLESFINVAELKSFTKASRKLSLTQTAITQQIQALEEHFGTRLIDRSVRPVRLTPAGEAFLTEAKAILERMDSSVARVQAAAAGESGTLSVGYIKGYERSDLSEKVCGFHRAFPNIFITFHRKSSGDLFRGLLSGAYDLIYTWRNTTLLADEDIRTQVVEETPLDVALYHSHPFANRTSLTRRELANERFIYMTSGENFPSANDTYYLNLYQQAGYLPNILHQTNDAEDILMMVAAEQGISILPAYVTRRLADAVNLVFVPLSGEGEGEVIAALWRGENENRALFHYIDFIQTFHLNAQLNIDNNHR